MDPDEPLGWWNKHRFDGSNAEVKPRPSPLIRDCMYGPNFSTNGTFTGRHGPAKTSTTRRSDRPSPRICDDQFVGAACPQNHNNRAMRAATSIRSNKPSGFFHASNEENYECEMMRIESHDEYSHNAIEATKPQSVSKESKIESLLEKLLDSHEKTYGRLEDELKNTKTELVAKIEEVSVRVSKVEEELHCARFDLQIAKEDIQRQYQKSLSMERNLESLEGRYDWDIGVLQKKLTSPNPSVDWEEDPLRDDLKKKEEEVSTNSTCSTEGNVKSKVAFFDVMATKKQSNSPSRDQTPSPRCESLRPHGHAPGMRPDSPRPHSRDGSMRPCPSLQPTSANPSPHDEASSVRPGPPRPHTRASSMRQLTCSPTSFWRTSPSSDSEPLSPTEGPRPKFPAQVTPHHFGDGENDLEESRILVDKSQNLIQKEKGEETEVLYKKGKLLQNPREKGKSLSINTCEIPSHILQETKRRESNNRDELMGESKELTKSSLKTDCVAPMGREEQEPFGPTLATDPLTTRNPTLPYTGGEGSETPDPCSQNVSPLQEDQEGEAVVVEEGTMEDLKKTEELNPKFLETTINQSFEETKEEDELTSTPKTDRTTTLRSPDPTDDPRLDHDRSDGRVVGPRTALYRPYGRDGTMRLASDCSTGQRPQHFQPDNRHGPPRPHGQAPCVRPDPRRPHGQHVGLRQSNDPSYSQPADLRQPPDHRQPVCRTVDLRTHPQPTSQLYDLDTNHVQPLDQSHDLNADPCAQQKLTNLQPPDRTIYSPPDIEWKTNWQEVMGMDTKGRCKATGLIKPRGMEKEDGESSYSQVCTISSTSNDSFSQESEKEGIRRIPNGCEEWSEEEIDAYYAEQAIEMSLGDYSREDATYDDFFTDEDDDREPREAYSCMVTRVPLEESAEESDTQRFQKELKAIEPGSFEFRQPPGPHLGPSRSERSVRKAQPRYSLPPYGEYRPYHPYAANPRARDNDRSNSGRYQETIRMPHEIFQERGLSVSRPRPREDRLEILMSGYSDYQKLLEKTIHDKIDRINVTLSARVDEIWSHVRHCGGKGMEDFEATGRRLEWIEETLSKHFNNIHEGGRENAEVCKLIGRLFNRCDSISKMTQDREDEMEAKIEKLERQIKREVTLREVIEMRINDLEEILRDEFARCIRSHDLLTEIDSTLKEKYREIDKKLNEFKCHVAGHEEDANDEETEPSDDIEEDRPDLLTIYNIAKARQKSSQLQELKNGEASEENGDQPFGGMEENLMENDRGMLKEADPETCSPSA